MLKKTLGCVAALLFVAATVTAADISVENIKCVISGGDADADQAVDYKDGKIFFCCENCPADFKADDAKMAMKANHQLVATKQYEQKGCPMSGGPVTEGTEIMVAGAQVGFCCNNCKGKVEGAEDDAAKMKLVFNNKSFEKAFKKASADKE